LKLLIDESLSAQVAAIAREHGHDAIHVGDLGLLGAVDELVMLAAVQDGRIVVAADTDFGELLAIGRHTEPSVVLLRRAPHRPGEQAALMLEALVAAEYELEETGAIVVASPAVVRVRELPFP
jgi:predicted nuclease of predicted toxin-antitoxin system